MSIERRRLLRSIAHVIADYRNDDLPARTPDDVEAWIEQFDGAVQVPILEEMEWVLERTYYSEERMRGVIAEWILWAELESDTDHWLNANFLAIQRNGTSQRRLLDLFDECLREYCSFELTDCGSDDGPYIYLDDMICTGSQLRWDLLEWIESEDAPERAEIVVMAPILHEGCTDYVTAEIERAGGKAGKDIRITEWTHNSFCSDRECRGSETHVLLPRAFIPDDPYLQRLKRTLLQSGHPFQPRRTMTTPQNVVFSCEERRHILEQEFLRAGARIKYELCPRLPANQWPLGFHPFKCCGFGTMFVTHRNCPNNAPLALWAGDPWIPLFPRRSNAKSNPAGEPWQPDDDIPF